MRVYERCRLNEVHQFFKVILNCSKRILIVLGILFKNSLKLTFRAFCKPFSQHFHHLVLIHYVEVLHIILHFPVLLHIFLHPIIATHNLVAKLLNFIFNPRNKGINEHLLNFKIALFFVQLFVRGQAQLHQLERVCHKLRLINGEDNGVIQYILEVIVILIFPLPFPIEPCPLTFYLICKTLTTQQSIFIVITKFLLMLLTPFTL